MFKKALHFIKYNNAMILIIFAVFLLMGGVFAQTEIGQEMVGQKQVSTTGVDNTLLLAADIKTMDMNFKIEKIEEDNEYYYITYTYLDLVNINSAWQYQLQEKVRKITKNLKKDLGEYLSEEFEEYYQLRFKELKEEQAKAEEEGEQQRVEVTEYSGLIGQTFSIADKLFPGYEAVKKVEVPAPSIPPTVILTSENGVSEMSENDNFSEIYNNYISENDSDRDDIFGIVDNCPNIYNPDQIDSDNDGVGDLCDVSDEAALLSDIATSDEEVITETFEEATIQNEIAEQSSLQEILENEEDVEVIELPVE